MNFIKINKNILKKTLINNKKKIRDLIELFDKSIVKSDLCLK